MKSCSGLLLSVLIFSAGGFDAASAVETTGRVCVQAIPIGDDWRANDTGATEHSVFTVRIDDQPSIRVSTNSSGVFTNLSLATNHLVRIQLDGRPLTSFRFKLSGQAEHGMLWYNPFYGTWSLSGIGPGQKCACQSSSAHASTNATLGLRIASAARQQVGVTKEYDSSYTKLDYPGGDVPLHTGVCCDVVVRALRGVNLDLQKEVHEDMAKNFSAYPQKWGLKAPDKNIDQRRVPNLMRYFERNQVAIREKLDAPETYLAGDIVAWDLGGGVLHIGVVSDRRADGRPLCIHNIGSGAKEENVLFQHQIIGHYRVKGSG